MLLQNTILSHPMISTILATPPSQQFLIAIVAYTVFKFFLVLYRISPLHPLAKVPGPRFAAATWWYRTYYEVWPHSGEMTNELHRLHAKYGPVVRIAPNEVHFASTSAYHHIYSYASKATKDPSHYKCFNADLSSVSLCDPLAAKERREILNPFFARRNVLAMQHIIKDKLCLFTHQLRSIYATQAPIIDLCFATKSFTNDLIMEFCFGKSFDALRTPGFKHSFLVSNENALSQFWSFKHFPLFKFILFNLMSDKLASSLLPEGAILLKIVLGSQVDRFMADPAAVAAGGVGQEVIFHRLLGLSRLGQEEKNEELLQRPKLDRQTLYDESATLMYGGTGTVANTISVGVVHILSSPGVLDELMVELKTVWPGNPWEGMPELGEYIDGSGTLPVGWETLEKLPYLSGVIKESLRMSNGTVSPLQRLAPTQGITIDGWTFPAGTGVSSANPFVHNDPLIFPEPHKFRPDRWIGPDAAGLEKNLVSFSKGPRQCPGMNLAWCELYLAFATLFRRFEFELVDTTPEDLKYKDYVVPKFVGDVNVRAKPRVD